MERARARPRFALALASALVLVAAAAPSADTARPRLPSLDVQSAASLAPDGSALKVQLIALCPGRSTIVEATVAVSQPQASGQGSFTLPCNDALTPLTVDVPATAGAFELGRADVSATLRVQRGRTEEANDAENVFVQPSVDVAFTGAARLDGGDVLIDLRVACPVGATGVQSYVNVTGEQGSGNGSYVPTCDGVARTITVRVSPSQGVFVPGCARALTFANVVHDGTSFAGIADTLIEIGA